MYLLWVRTPSYPRALVTTYVWPVVCVLSVLTTDRTHPDTSTHVWRGFRGPPKTGRSTMEHTTVVTQEPGGREEKEEPVSSVDGRPVPDSASIVVAEVSSVCYWRTDSYRRLVSGSSWGRFPRGTGWDDPVRVTQDVLVPVPCDEGDHGSRVESARRKASGSSEYVYRRARKTKTRNYGSRGSYFRSGNLEGR